MQEKSIFSFVIICPLKFIILFARNTIALRWGKQMFILFFKARIEAFRMLWR